MRKYIFLFCLSTIYSISLYASFPVIELSEPLLTTSSDTSAWGIVALVCGVLGLLFPFLGIPALIFGAMGLKKKKRGLAIAGLVLGIIEVLFLILAIVVILLFAYNY